jgi:hypothetical protein
MSKMTERKEKIKAIKARLSDFEARWFESYCAEFPNEDLEALVVVAKDKAAMQIGKSKTEDMKKQLTVQMLDGEIDAYCCRYENIYNPGMINLKFKILVDMLKKNVSRTVA